MTGEPLAQRPVAVLICYTCGPGGGSEVGAGWVWAQGATEVADVVLVTHTSEFRPAVEAAVADGRLRARVEWVDIPGFMRRHMTGKLAGMLQYCLWQVKVARLLRRIEREERIDVVHQVTWASDSLPTALAVSRAPVRVWGPVGGTTGTAPPLYRYLTPAGVAAEVFRGVVTGFLRLVFGTWAARHATLVVAMNPDVARRWRRQPTPVEVEMNTGLTAEDLEGSASAPPWTPDGQKVAVFAARLIPLKGLLLAVRSLQHAPGWRLVVLGDGPDHHRAVRLARRLGLADRVEFRGRVRRSEVLAAFAAADALLFPSFHDSASWAVGEASALGCPVVCLDAAGPPSSAGRNAHVVPIAPARSLPERMGRCLTELTGRGEPDNHLEAARIPGLLRNWYRSEPG